MNAVVLVYVGRRTASGDPEHLDGVPARDLSASDIETCGWSVEALERTGLYRRTETEQEEV